MTARSRRALLAASGLFVLALISGGGAYAHGVGYRQLPGGSAVALQFSYSTGDPMSYVEAKVYSPSDEKFTYQSGRTDESGGFAFVPRVAGTWRVVVRDDEGHMAEAAIAVGGEFFGASGSGETAAASNPPLSGGALYVRAALGVSVIFNAALVVVLARKRRAGAVKRDAH
jgi:nickel transport protein